MLSWKIKVRGKWRFCLDLNISLFAIQTWWMCSKCTGTRKQNQLWLKSCFSKVVLNLFAQWVRGAVLVHQWAGSSQQSPSGTKGWHSGASSGVAAQPQPSPVGEEGARVHGSTPTWPCGGKDNDLAPTSPRSVEGAWPGHVGPRVWAFDCGKGWPY